MYLFRNREGKEITAIETKNCPGCKRDYLQDQRLCNQCYKILKHIIHALENAKEVEAPKEHISKLDILKYWFMCEI